MDNIFMNTGRLIAQATSLVGSLTIAVLALASVGIMQRQPVAPASDGVTFNFNERKPSVSADLLRAATFGYERAVTNLLWIRFLQYTPTEKVPPGQLSWIYFDLDTIGTVDPGFLPVFEQGAIFLSVITEDKDGAERLLRKGATLYPGNWVIRGNLGYHYQFELKDRSRAAIEYKAAAENPNAPWLFRDLAISLSQEQDSPAASIAFVESLLKNAGSPEVRTRLEERLAELKKQVPKRKEPK